MAKKKKDEVESFDKRMALRIDVLEREKSISFLEGYSAALRETDELIASFREWLGDIDGDSLEVIEERFEVWAKRCISGLKRNNQPDDVDKALKVRGVNPAWR